MGTNFHAIRISDIDKMNTDTKMNSLKSVLNLPKIHIGIYSKYNPFLFVPNKDLYTEDTIFEFLKGCLIISEPGNIHSMSEFKEIVLDSYPPYVNTLLFIRESSLSSFNAINGLEDMLL